MMKRPRGPITNGYGAVPVQGGGFLPGTLDFYINMMRTIPFGSFTQNTRHILAYFPQPLQPADQAKARGKYHGLPHSCFHPFIFRCGLWCQMPDFSSSLYSPHHVIPHKHSCACCVTKSDAISPIQKNVVLWTHHFPLRGETAAPLPPPYVTPFKRMLKLPPPNQEARVGEVRVRAHPQGPCFRT